MSDRDQRRYPRFLCSYSARVSGSSGRLINLSVGGVGVRLSTPPEVGRTVSVSIAFPGHWFRMKFRGTVVHRSGEQIGVQFNGLSDKQQRFLETAIAALQEESDAVTGAAVSP